MEPTKLFKPLNRILKKDKSLNSSQRTGSVEPKITQYPYDLDYKTYEFSTVLNAYGIQSSPKSNVTVGIIELGGGYLPSDLEKCMTANGFPNWKAAEHVFPVFIDNYNDGNTNVEENFYADLDSSVEVALDVEFVAVCIPNGRINVYFAPNTFSGDSFINAVNRAIDDNCTTISISWGAYEFNSPNNYIYSFEKVFKKAASKGISIFAANGDFGDVTDYTSSIQNNTLGYQVGYPASSPYVTSCGGTILSLELENGTYSKYSKETTWVEDVGVVVAGNGGTSNIFDKPSYQKELDFKSNFNSNPNRRGTPDVSGNASVYNGYTVYFDGETTRVGGVSAVSPMWAGFTAGLGCNVFIIPYLYKLPKECFHDIKNGINYPYESKEGYDLCTGLGSPNGKVLTKVLRKIFKKQSCKKYKK